MKLIDNDYAKSESAYHHHDSRNEKYQIKYLYTYILRILMDLGNMYRNTKGLDSNKINDSTIMINMQFICLAYLPYL